MQDDANGVAPAREGLVDAVVDKFDNEMVQTTEIRGSDVHPRAPSDRFESFEDLDLVGGIRILANPARVQRGRRRVAVSGACFRLCFVLIGGFEACDVGYVCCSGCDVSAGVGANAETARLLRR